MGLFDKIKRKFAEMSKISELRSLEVGFKEQVLSRMKDEHLKKIATYERILWSEKADRKMLIDRLARELSVDVVLHYAQQFRVRFADLKKEFENRRKLILMDLARIKGQIPKEFEYEMQYEDRRNILDDILDLIESEFEPEPIRNEEDLEKQLAIFLKVKGLKFQRQYCLDGRYFVDIVFDGNYGLELKVADTPRKILELVGQIKMYRRRLTDCAALIAVPEERDEESIADYLNLLDEEGIRYRVLYCKVLKTP